MEDDTMTGALTDNEELITRLGQLFEEEESAAPLLKSDPLALLRSSLGALLHLSRCYALWQHDDTIAPQICHIRADLQHRLATETGKHHENTQDANLVSGEAIDFYDEELVANIKKEKDDCDEERTGFPIILASYSLTSQPVESTADRDAEKEVIETDGRTKQTSEETFIERGSREKGDANPLENNEFPVDALQDRHTEKAVEEEIVSDKFLETIEDAFDGEDVTFAIQPETVIDLSSESGDNDDVVELPEKPPPSSVRKNDAELEGNFPCEECPYVAKKKFSLNLHMRVHSKKSSKRNCQVCGYRALSKTKLAIHKRIHTGERPYECQLCAYCTNQKGNLNAHIAKKHSVAELNRLNKIKPQKRQPEMDIGGDVFCCKLCKFKSKYKGNLVKHTRVIHERSGKMTRIRKLYKKKKPSAQSFAPTLLELQLYSCPLCDHKTPHAAHLKLHMKKHSLPRRAPQKNKFRKTGDFSCDECDFQCKYFVYMVKHKKVHGDGGSAAIAFEEPRTTDASAAAGDAPELFIETEKQLSFRHPAVPKNVKTKHLDLHSKNQIFVCAGCGYKTLSASRLTLHQKDECRRRVGKKNRPTVKNKSPPSVKIEKFFCKECDFVAPSQMSLNSHMKCHVQQRRAREEALKSVAARHPAVHVKTNGTIKTDVKKMNGVVDYGKPEIKSEIFNRSIEKSNVRADANDEITKHYSRETTGEKLLACKRCSFKSKLRCNMKKHLELHSRNHIFVCAGCGYKTLSASRLTIHQRDECRNKVAKNKRPTVIKKILSVEIEKFFCKECDFLPASKMSLNSHMKRHVRERRAREEALKNCNVAAPDSEHRFDFVDYKPPDEILGGGAPCATAYRPSEHKPPGSQQDPLEIGRR